MYCVRVCRRLRTYRYTCSIWRRLKMSPHLYLLAQTVASAAFACCNVGRCRHCQGSEKYHRRIATQADLDPALAHIRKSPWQAARRQRTYMLHHMICDAMYAIVLLQIRAKCMHGMNPIMMALVILHVLSIDHNVMFSRNLDRTAS